MGKHQVKRLIDFTDQLRIHALLKEAMEPDGSEKDGKPFYKFKKGWDDRKVAKETGYDETQIERFRREKAKMALNPFTAAGLTSYHFQPHGALQVALNRLGERVDNWERALKDWTAVAHRQEDTIERMAREIDNQRKVISELDSALGKVEDALTKPKAAE